MGFLRLRADQHAQYRNKGICGSNSESYEDVGAFDLRCFY